MSNTRAHQWAKRISPNIENLTLPDGAVIDLNDCGPTSVSVAERCWLADHAYGKVVLELGSHVGGSTSFLAKVAQRVCSVDWHQGDATVGFGSTFLEFQVMLDTFRVTDKVCVHVGRFEDVLQGNWHVRDTHYDVVFLDGEHTAASVARDLALIFANVQTDLIAVHDYGLYETAGGIAAGTIGRPWNFVDLIDTLAIVRRSA